MSEWMMCSREMMDGQMTGGSVGGWMMNTQATEKQRSGRDKYVDWMSEYWGGFVGEWGGR